EAFAASKPTVLSDVSPHRTLVGEDQQRGLLFEPGSPKALADALQELIEDAELRTAKGRAGRLWVVDERRWPDLGRMVREVHRTAQAL
ncbi:glycosyltransferase, partial [Staphylococcus aureus]|nr:glycosyltransferase [Staphylococcus aureus]